MRNHWKIYFVHEVRLQPQTRLLGYSLKKKSQHHINKKHVNEKHISTTPKNVPNSTIGNLKEISLNFWTPLDSPNSRLYKKLESIHDQKFKVLHNDTPRQISEHIGNTSHQV